MDGIPMAGRGISLSQEDTSGFRNFSFILLPADSAAQHGCYARNGRQHGTWRRHDLTPVALEAHHSCRRVLLMMNDLARRILLMISSNIACMTAEKSRDEFFALVSPYSPSDVMHVPEWLILCTYFCLLSEQCCLIDGTASQCLGHCTVISLVVRLERMLNVALKDLPVVTVSSANRQQHRTWSATTFRPIHLARRGLGGAHRQRVPMNMSCNTCNNS
jgi:hypothetical protein